MRRLRPLRRLTAFVAQLLLVQLAFASGAASCPLDDAGAVMAVATAHGGEHHMADAGTATQHVSGATTAPTHAQPASPASHHHAGGHCEMACAPASCASPTHCSASAASSAGTTAELHARASGRVAADRDGAPRSVGTGPEPPPPRA